ncbi:MAG TPA: Bcr/CflA family efflux MFS transporter [Marinobacter sp.]|uniref:Bcr/CflA family efflux transporter n=3 Tax=root TaxID=1 RepID=A0A831R262_9GAMM|nr:Bcr/CflA family efflux MFS transporter [Marinobacter sp.]HEA51462.1 Bcr/CflA family efflux MFS transporter [Marinobacter antarcticus]
MTVALGPLALDAYLPAFPKIADDLGVGHGGVGLTLSAYVMALGLAQLLGGPLSDRYGRQQVLFTGLAVFSFAAFMIAQAQTLPEMLGWRIVQGVGGAFCAVSVPAIVRDQSSGQDAARMFGLIGLVMFVAPAAAPSIGSMLLYFSEWHAIFLMLAGYGALLAIILHFVLFRRLPSRQKDKTPVSTLVTNYALVLRHRVTMRFVGIQALCFSAMLVFITHASFIYQEWFGLSNVTFSALFAANVVTMASLNLFNRRLLNRYPSVRILRVCVFLQATAVTALVVSAWAEAPYWVVAACIILSVGFMGAIIPNNMANALEFFPHLGGTAAAMLGAAQFTIAGAVSALSAPLAGGTLLPIVLAMAVCIYGAAILAAGGPTAVERESGFA